MEKITFKIDRHLGTLSKNEKNWTKEINLVSWNNASAKLDIRPWNEDHSKCGKGITLTDEEAVNLKDILEIEF